MKLRYVNKNFQDRTLRTIRLANEIIEEYVAQGFALTLRQIYYQMVARGLIPNRQTEYKRLGSILADARLAGLTDWEAIVDRTRSLRELSHWGKPQDILDMVVEQYRIRKWETQHYQPQVWIEKDALVGVIEGPCNRLDVPFFSCRGYNSLSAMWRAGVRAAQKYNKDIIIFHLADHDPSGIDMTRDNRERLGIFASNVDVRRIALTMDQVEEYDPPPNPTKLSDSRARGYIERFGYDSWELDALEPGAINELIEEHILSVRDEDLWQEAVDLEAEHVEALRIVAEEFEG